MYWRISSKEPLSISCVRVEIRPVGEVSSLRIVEKVSETRAGVISRVSLARDGWGNVVVVRMMEVVSDWWRKLRLVACSDDDVDLEEGAVTGDFGAMNALLQLTKWQQSTAIVAMDSRGIFCCVIA